VSKQSGMVVCRALQPCTPMLHSAVPPLLRNGVPVYLQLRGDEDVNGDEDYLVELEDALLRRRTDARSRQQAGRQRRPRRPTQPSPRFTRESTQLPNLLTTLRGAYDDFLQRPGQPLVLGSFSLLLGFYLAGALSTIFGAAGFWEPTIAVGPLVVGEAISRRYYTRPLHERSQTLRLLNALKVGFYLGVVVDALKLAG